MSTLDSKVASILDSSRHATSDDEDDLIAELENDDSLLPTFREQRLQQLHSEYQRAHFLKSQPGHGVYQTIKDEKELMDITTSTKLCVVHFLKSDFNRCRIMEGKLETLAEKHWDTRFVGIDVDNAPFLVVKLGIKVLPCVISFVDGKGSDRIVGFEGVGRGGDKISAREVEARLLQSGVLVRAKMVDEEEVSMLRRRKEDDEAREIDDDDWD
ncbi:thioredoxin-like protein [Polychaeton citri CBS 116435]|uniref:Thioredoxin-like protein n=1 Tax=Polychaeton citri CBS 116435 TaxID=1314669 RepID=A0A9P4Q4Z0_9PEZI|nr:thioredoxin-like protein [Polychaeton citri CBS 116435]